MSGERKLQRACFWFIDRGLVVGTLLLVGLLALAGRAHDERSQTDVMQVSRLVIKDSKGRPRIALGVDDKDRATLGLYDKKGIERGIFVVPSDSDAVLQLNDRDGRPRVQLIAIDNFAKGGLYLYDGRDGQKPRAGIALSVIGTPMLFFADQEAKERFLVTSMPDGTSRIRISAPDGTVTWTAPGESKDE